MHDSNHSALPLVIVRDGLASRDFDKPFPTLIATSEEIAAGEQYLSQELDRRRNHKVIDGALVPQPIGVRVSAVLLLGALVVAGIATTLHPEHAGIAAASVTPAILLFLVCLWRYELAHRATK